MSSENLPIEVKFSDGTPGTAFPTLYFRISYAEREPATSRVGPMVLFNHQTIRTNWPPALPGYRQLLMFAVMSRMLSESCWLPALRAVSILRMEWMTVEWSRLNS